MIKTTMWISSNRRLPRLWRGHFNNYTIIKNFILDLLFPQCCLNCGCEKSYLCQDCLATLEILESNFCLCKKSSRLPQAGKCKRCQPKKLNGLYFASSYQNNLVRKLIQQFKYQPFIKELAKPLTSLIITHFQLLNNKLDFSDFVLTPIPLDKKKLKQRGFNQAEEIGKELSNFLKIPLMSNVLLKIKETLPQIELSEKEREKNIKGVFSVKNNELVNNKKILLVDDVYTTGSTMEEGAKTLKESGAKEVWGVVAARG